MKIRMGFRGSRVQIPPSRLRINQELFELMSGRESQATLAHFPLWYRRGTESAIVDFGRANADATSVAEPARLHLDDQVVDGRAA